MSLTTNNHETNASDSIVLSVQLIHIQMELPGYKNYRK